MVEYRPDDPSLIGSRLKLRRAEEQLDELESEIKQYVGRDPFSIREEPDLEEDGWMVMRFGDVREKPDPMWGVRFGEFLHDLRSALDNLVWQLVLVNGEEPGGHNQFPIYTKPPGRPWDKTLRKDDPEATRIDEMLLGVHADHTETIKELQPYLGEYLHRDHRIALAVVRDLNNIDKHKWLHPTFGWSHEGEGARPIHIAGPKPADIEVQYLLGPIYTGAEVLRWRLLGATRETRVALHGGVPWDVAFGHPRTTLAHLDWIRERISDVIERFGPAFDPRS